ncbi:DUF5011 domain-containing protein [Pleionea sediminis]|uniref:DUF5011 domain-containing protein n=1 Tax=Pleionea sediminis TaxID=2569479 RepID=UPI001184EC2D|nr:DUF5011 domain-containing protein [Pleionea sediminis]
MKNFLLLLMAMLLVACGGSSSSPEPGPDTTPPTIEIKGPTTVYHEVGTAYSDAGADYSDNSGEAPTTSQQSNINVDVMDTYTVTYTATDAAGNEASATRTVVVTGKSFVEFFNFTRDELGANRSDFRDSYLKAIEAFIYAEEALKEQDYSSAKTIVENVFQEQPLYDNIWRNGAADFGLHNGDPVAYYGLRMIDKITQELPLDDTGTLQLTAVIVECSQVTRPINTDYELETVNLDVDERLLANDYKALREATYLFRQWIKAITQGLAVELVIHRQEECTTTSFDRNEAAGFITSYPNTSEIISRVPNEIAKATNIWLVISPSGVQGDGTGYPYWITGGMGLSPKGTPLIIGDDLWFVRKPVHLGSGEWTPVERRVYHPQWFQHEFMHHIYRTWPEFQLEIEGHDWFNRAFWPDDFEGRWEPDFYWESIEKRLMNANPSLSDGLNISDWVGGDINELGFDALLGSYERRPVTNGYHEVEIVKNGDSYFWTNAAGVEWLLYEEDGKLRVNSSYGNLEIIIKLSDSDAIEALHFNGEPYVSTQNKSAQNILAKALKNNSQNHTTKQHSEKIFHCSH